MKSSITPKGRMTITSRNIITGEVSQVLRENTVLTVGKNSLSKALAGELTGSYDLYVETMSFGTNGESGGVPKVVDPSRTGLFGASVADKIVTASIPASAPHTVLFTAVLGSTEANGNVINEALLSTKDGTAFSMLTFGGLTKTSSIELTLTWEILFV